MLVVEVGKVKLALPPRLSKIVQLFNEGNNTKVNGQCHVLHDQNHVFGDHGNHSNGSSPNTLHTLTNGEVEDGSTVKLTNGFHTPSPDLSEDGVSRERRDYRGLVKVHKGKRKLPELPTDPKMSIFNNIDKLGVLEAELDVKKLEVKIRRQRQKVAAEFRSLTPEQRRELVVESPYLQKQIQRAMKSRAVNRTSTISDITAESEETTQSSDQDSLSQTPSPSHVTSPQNHVTSAQNHVTSPSRETMSESFSSSISTATCSTPKHSPPHPPSISLDSTLDMEDSLNVVTSCCDLIAGRGGLCSGPSPLPLPQTLEDEIVSICSSGPDTNFTTPTTTPTLQTSSSSSDVTTINLLPPLAPSETLLPDSELPPPPPVPSSETLPSSVPSLQSNDHVTSVSDVEPIISLDDEELPPYSEHDLTFVTPLPDCTSSHLHNSFSTEALEISHTPTHDQSRKVLSDSEVSVVSVHTPVSNHGNLVVLQVDAQQNCARRSELCTPIHSSSLSASDSQLHRKKVPDQKESYERAQSVPYGIEKSSLSSDVENVLAKKFVNQQKSYSSKSISDKLEEIQSKHSPRSFLNTSSQDVSSYTLSYEDDLGAIGDMTNLYDDVVNSVTVETDAGCKIQLDFDSDDFVSHMNARNEKENILCNLVSLDTGLGNDPSGTKSRDVTMETKSRDVNSDTELEHEKKERDAAILREVEEMKTTNEVLEGLSTLVLDDIISSYTKAFTPPPPPYVSTTVEMRVAHTTDEVRNLADQAVDYFTSCVKCGKPIDLNRAPDSIPEYADPVSYRAFRRLLTCQAHELFMQAAVHFNLIGPPVKPPPWIRDQIKPPQPPWLLKGRRSRRHTLDSVKRLITEEVVSVTTSQFFSIEGILSKEVVQTDASWQDFNKDEVAMKFRLADILLVNLLQDTVNSFKRISTKKKKEGMSPSSSPSFALVDKSEFQNNPRQRYSRQRTLSF
ncbi:hypothetical protein ACHWQZ_G016373 [Mnemiopsis leidyi]